VADGERGTAGRLCARKLEWWPPVCGSLLKSPPRRRGFQTWKPPTQRAPRPLAQPQQGIVSGMLDQVKDEMKDEIASLTSAAVGAVISILREMFKQAMPALAPHLEKAHTKRGCQASDSPA
jgi:hypothetical protein